MIAFLLVDTGNIKIQNTKITNIQTNGTKDDNLSKIDEALTDIFKKAGEERSKTDVVGEIDNTLDNMGDSVGKSLNAFQKFTRLFIGEENYNKLVSFKNWIVNNAKYIVSEFGRVLGEWFN